MIIDNLVNLRHRNFNGLVNVVNQNTGQHLGKLEVKGGLYLYSSYKNIVGRKSLFQMLADSLERTDLGFILEPEKLLDDDVKRNSQKLLLINSIMELEIFKKSYGKVLKLIPPKELVVSCEAIKLEGALQPQEKIVLNLLCEGAKSIGALYNISDEIVDYEINLALISLRKKGILRVRKINWREDEIPKA